MKAYKMQVFVLAAVFAVGVFCDTFLEFKQEMEDIVMNLTIEMNEIFEDRCNYSVATCDVLSYYECNGTDAKRCFMDFPHAPVCLDNGTYLSESSAVIFPPETYSYELTYEQKQFVCTSALLEDSFKHLDQNRGKRYGRALLGTYTGTFRSYPAIGGCHEYDPRYRPWYVGATSGAKNVMLIIDSSGSMSDGNRMGYTKQAAIDVVNTLSNADYVGAVKFSQDADYLYSEKMERATTEVKEGLVSAISDLSPDGSTNYAAAIRKAFSMFKAAQKDEYGAPCTDGENIFMFLSDGEPTEGVQDTSSILSIIAEYNLDVRFFTYGLGSGVNPDILKAMACNHQGMMFSYDGTGSDEKSGLRDAMRNYYNFMAEGVTIDQPVWTEPYEDAFGLGWLVTVSMPIYYYEEGERTILGVMGLDVSLQHLQSYGYSEEQVTQRLITNSPCHISNLTDCELETFREVTCDIANCNGSSSRSLDSCLDLPPDNIFLQPVQNNASICCGLYIGQLVGIIIGSVLFLIIVGVGIACIRKNRAQKYQQ